MPGLSVEIDVSISETMPFGPATLPVGSRSAAIIKSEFVNRTGLVFGSVTFNGTEDQSVCGSVRKRVWAIASSFPGSKL